VQAVWQHIEFDKSKSKELQEALQINATLCDLLVQRGIESYDDAKAFFRPNLSHLHHPLLMLNMDKALARIEAAIKAKQRILFFGDYDVDGTTSVSLMYLFFKQFYTNIDYYIPDRNKEG